MLKKIFFWIAIVFVSGLQAQEITTPYRTKKIWASRDTIHIDSVSVNPEFFELLDSNANPIDSAFYKINFEKGALVFTESSSLTSDSLTVNYLNYPKSLTKVY